MLINTETAQVVEIKVKKLRGIRYRQSTNHWVEHTKDNVSGEYHIVGELHGRIHLYNQLEGLDIYIEHEMLDAAMTGKEITLNSCHLEPKPE